MDWTFENFKNDLENLEPKVRDKAIEIAKKLMKEEGYTEASAIKEGMDRAEEWFMDIGG